MARKGRFSGMAQQRGGTVYATQTAAPPVDYEVRGARKTSNPRFVRPHMFPNRYGRPILFLKEGAVNTIPPRGRSRLRPHVGSDLPLIPWSDDAAGPVSIVGRFSGAHSGASCDRARRGNPSGRAKRLMDGSLSPVSNRARPLLRRESRAGELPRHLVRGTHPD